MNAIEMLIQQLDTVNIRLHHSAADLAPEELVARPLPGVNPIGFILWHMARSQDWAVNTALRDAPEVIKDPRWRDTSLAVPGIGTGFAPEEAGDVAGRVDLPTLLAYADAVHGDAVAWLRANDDAVGRKGGLPAWVYLSSVAVTHLHRHLGEVDLIKAVLRVS